MGIYKPEAWAFYKHHWLSGYGGWQRAGVCWEPPIPTLPPPPATLQSAAHLAGFMGRELTSGRLPCYPSSVWKLIPSSVSRPRDPSAGDLTRVSAVCVTPRLPSGSPRERERESLDVPDVCETPDAVWREDGSTQIFFTILYLPLISQCLLPANTSILLHP